MTGFGQAAQVVGGQKITVLVKSVNNKGLSVRFRMPRELLHLEQSLHALASDFFSRGRIDVSLTLEGSEGGSVQAPDINLARSYIEGAEKLAKEFCITSCPDAFSLVTLPGIMQVKDVSETEGFDQAVQSVCREALESLQKSRRAEGSGQMAVFSESLKRIAELAAPVAEAHSKRLNYLMGQRKKRVAELVGNASLDETRMLQELALLSDRIDISEEYQRLLAHVESAAGLLESNVSGRKLGFILQEIHRELNTMGSKVDESQAAYSVIEMKDILGALREQVANVQ